MSGVARFSSWWRFLAIAMGLALVLTIAGRHVLFGPPILELGDLAVNALQIENAKEGRELYGNYSRFHFNHPGPAFFYCYALGERLLHDTLQVVRSPYQAHLWTGLVLQSLFGAGALTILSRRLSATLTLPLALLTTAIYFGWTGTAFTSLWPPYVLAVPFLCYLTACASAASGYPRDGLLAIIAGGFLVHGHVAQALMVGGLGAVTLAFAVWRHCRGDQEASRWQRRHSGYAILLLALFLLPLILDFVRHGLTGNTATIVRRFITNTGDAKTPLQALLYFLSFATPARDQDVLFREIGPLTWQFFSEHRGWFFGWGVMLLLIPLILLFVRRRLIPAQWQFLASAAVLWIVTVGLCVAWGVAQAGPMFHYNGAFFISVYLFPLLLGAAAIAQLWAKPIGLWIPAVITTAAGLVILLRLTLAPLNPDVEGEPIRRAVVAATQKDGTTRPKVLLFEAEQWPVAASVALSLERAGITWYTMPRWNFMFQQQHDLGQLGRAGPREADLWLVEATGDGAGFPAQTVTITSLPQAVRPGETVIDHATNFERFAYSGLEVTKPEPVWTVAERATLVLHAEPTDADVQVILDAAANDRVPGGPRPQPARVWFDGSLVGEVTVDERRDHVVTIPQELWNKAPSPARLELEFSQAVADNSFTRPRSRDVYAWALWTIRFERAP